MDQALRQWATALTKVALASFVMSAVVVGVSRLLYAFASEGNTISQAAVLAATIGPALAALLIAGRVLQIDEFATVGAELRRRVQMLLGR